MFRRPSYVALSRGALSVNERYHSLLLEATSSIPLMEPGDTVFWHPDVLHAVENEHRDSGYSNVMYIGATVGCPTEADLTALVRSQMGLDLQTNK